jgi:hypothetical protein
VAPVASMDDRHRSSRPRPQPAGVFPGRRRSPRRRLRGRRCRWAVGAARPAVGGRRAVEDGDGPYHPPGATPSRSQRRGLSAPRLSVRAAVARPLRHASHRRRGRRRRRTGHSQPAARQLPRVVGDRQRPVRGTGRRAGAAGAAHRPAVDRRSCAGCCHPVFRQAALRDARRRATVHRECRPCRRRSFAGGPSARRGVRRAGCAPAGAALPAPGADARRAAHLG